MKPDIRIIGAGFGRTGTDSMRAALEMLGFGPCHHMRTLNEDPAQRDAWRRFIAGDPADWKSLLGGYRSCLDWPSAHFWPELMTEFPDAKIVLTWRTPESWWTSFERTILPVLQSDKEAGTETAGGMLIPRHVFSGKPMQRDHGIAAYKANVEAVKRHVPADRLLIHEPGSGWAPLCEFLGTAIPATPFPKNNSTEEFRATVHRHPKGP